MPRPASSSRAATGSLAVALVAWAMVVNGPTRALGETSLPPATGRAKIAGSAPIRAQSLGGSWTTEGGKLNAFYGHSVATAGDVNGDGFSDVLVGSINYENGQYEEGRAFLYPGSAAGLATSPAWTAEGNQTIARFGQSVAAAGDVNGDGYGDVIIGAPQWDQGQSDEGRAFLYLGSSAGLSAQPSWFAEINQVDAFFGQSVAGAGDVNGDGFDDVLVSAYGFDNGQTNEGRVYLYLGSASGLGAVAAWTAESDQASAFFGVSVASAGDVDGDGFGDVIVGAHQLSAGEASEGRAYLYLGSAAGLSPVAAWTAEGNQIGAQLGVSVGTAGDVNGDGFADVIVGAHSFGNGQLAEGRALVYLGSASGLAASPAWTLEGDDAGAQLGRSVATAGDINGDGYADVIVGAPLYGATTSRGRAAVHLGSAAGLATAPAWSVESAQDDAALGQSVATAGDVNGDGFSDVVVGAPLHNGTLSDEGRALVFSGSADGPAVPASWIAEVDQGSAYFGYSVASAGDVNGDGYGDVVAGAIYHDNGEPNEGRAFLYLGSPQGLGASPAWTAESDQANSRFGQCVAGVGDVNGDGYDDVAVGAPQYVDGGVDDGRVFLYLGSPAGLGASPAWAAGSSQSHSRFGVSVAGAGDVNGDGYADVVVGATYFQNGQVEEGRAFVYHGTPAGLGAAPAWSAEGNQALAFFGFSVAGAGDVNGDGFGDVLVGAYGYDNGQSNEGRVFAFLGSVAGLGLTPTWTAESDQANAYFGYAVAGAGDVDGDGFSDVMAGAHTFDGGDADEGRASVFLGSPSGLAATAAWTAEANQAAASFGASVASAGDVDGDGFGDVIVGAGGFDNGQPDEGRAWLYRGGASGLSATPAWNAESDQSSANLGISVAGAGDVNGDGFGDLVVGAPYFDGGQLDEGRVALHYGNGRDGTDRRVRQLRADGLAPIALHGRSESAGFRLESLGRSAGGRSDVRMEWQAEPLGTEFGAAVERGAWFDPGAPAPGSGSAATLGEPVGGLELDAPYRWRLRVASRSPFFPHSLWRAPAKNGRGVMDLRTGLVTTSVPGKGVGASGSSVTRIRPNPSSARLGVTFVLSRGGPIRLAVHDLQGRWVASLARGVLGAGEHSVTWDGRDHDGASVRPGVYWMSLESHGQVARARFVRL